MQKVSTFLRDSGGKTAKMAGAFNWRLGRRRHMTLLFPDLLDRLHFILYYTLSETRKGAVRVETCNSRSMLVNIHFYHIWKP